MARTKQTTRVSRDGKFASVQPPPKLYSTYGLESPAKNFDYKDWEWTISKRWDILVKKPGEDKWDFLTGWSKSWNLIPLGKDKTADRRLLCDGAVLNWTYLRAPKEICVTVVRDWTDTYHASKDYGKYKSK
jgi:hypothetical protein